MKKTEKITTCGEYKSKIVKFIEIFSMGTWNKPRKRFFGFSIRIYFALTLNLFFEFRPRCLNHHLKIMVNSRQIQIIFHKIKLKFYVNNKYFMYWFSPVKMKLWKIIFNYFNKKFIKNSS